MKSRKSVVVAAIVAGVIVSVGGAGVAQAAEDSGVGLKTCSSTYYGKLSAYQQGSGNSWAPGDWTGGYSQWHSDTSYYRWIYDYQNYGGGGGYWRNATNGDYTSLTPSCSVAG